EQLTAERTGDVVDRPALLRHGLRELRTDLVPHALRLRGGERLDLETRLTERDRGRGDDLRVAVDLHAQLHAVARRQPDRPEVDASSDLGDLRDVPRSVVARRLGRLVLRLDL